MIEIEEIDRALEVARRHLQGGAREYAVGTLQDLMEELQIRRSGAEFVRAISLIETGSPGRFIDWPGLREEALAVANAWLVRGLLRARVEAEGRATLNRDKMDRAAERRAAIVRLCPDRPPASIIRQRLINDGEEAWAVRTIQADLKIIDET